MTNLYTGHEAEADRGATYNVTQRAIGHLESAIMALDSSSYLDFLPAPTDEEIRESAIRHAQCAIDILSGK